VLGKTYSLANGTLWVLSLAGNLHTYILALNLKSPAFSTPEMGMCPKFKGLGHMITVSPPALFDS